MLSKRSRAVSPSGTAPALLSHLPRGHLFPGWPHIQQLTQVGLQNLAILAQCQTALMVHFSFRPPCGVACGCHSACSTSRPVLRFADRSAQVMRT